jgi:hypothetical protein
MATDQQVSARMIMDAQLEFERRGAESFMQYLEKTEPELANFVFERLSLIYQQMLRLGGPPRETQRVFRQIQTLLIVSVESLRRGHLELWSRQMGPALGQLEPTEPGDTASDSPAEG